MEIGFIEVGEKYLELSLWVTLECNFACSYCYENGRKEFCYLNEENADKIIAFIIKLAKERNRDILWLNFHGGEPMLNFSIIKYVVNKLKECTELKKMYTSLTTNCSIYNEEIFDYICEISISLDGTPYYHDLNRKTKGGMNTYEAIIDNAKKYYNNSEVKRLRMVVTPNNVENLCGNLIHLYEEGFKNIVPGVDFFATDWKNEDFDTMYDQFVMFKDYLKKNDIKDANVGMLNETPMKHGRCFVGCDGYQFSADGKIYPCYYIVNDPEFVIGDVVNGLDEDAVKRFNCINQQDVETCKGCGNYEGCVSTKCYMLNKQLTNDFLTPSAVVCANERLVLRLSKVD